MWSWQASKNSCHNSTTLPRERCVQWKSHACFHLQQTSQIMYTLQGVPNGTGSFVTWLCSGLLGNSLWQGSCVGEVAGIAHECSPWRSRALPSCRPSASTGCTNKVKMRDSWGTIPQRAGCGQEDSYGCCRFPLPAKSRLPL